MTVTRVPTGPRPGERLATVGAGVGTVKLTLFVARLFTVTTSGPVDVPAGTAVTMLELLQEDTAAARPLKVMVLVPCVPLKPTPVMVTCVPAEAEYVES